ncbi:Gfo/Idh/MocA family oxidoreductase [Oscillatoria salina]|uniref:hypothetical protein n=1 Tax=Oscillatoria salina TaxID=331517 RepID=UPI0013BB615B|nr:hypothetical protein [Oscillatoria salina]MBZ8183086.1 hypothetical protein [Oscillatoria salina IIICB1]NET87521.1 hypothetical protein [Kamptonema sp. SIO1D9]
MNNNNQKACIILIGCGPHAKRIYLPALQKLGDRLDLALVIDLKEKESDVRAAVASKWNLKPEMWFIDKFIETMPEELDRKLSFFVAERKVTGAIVATEPLVHRTYAEWALSNELSILIDKPISARADSTTKLSNADGILDDYILLLARYQILQRKKETIFTVNSQRRFHPGFQFVKEQLREIAERTNCPVTFIQSYHCDGQWRFPSEIVTQEYHPYCFGYGKASHSGYHIFDTLYQLYAATGIEKKAADSMEIVSSFVQPNGFIKQLADADYYSLFGERYNAVKKWTDEELQEIYHGYGEIDLSALVTLKKHEEAIANFSINLVHNGFACRTWLQPGEDLYKGNGRVKHENHNIQQGPFQNIQIHSYQATDKHDNIDGLEDHLGGKNHFDIYVFRNPLLSDSQDCLRTYRLHEIVFGDVMPNKSTLVMERVKHKVVEEFVDYLIGKKDKSEIRSQIEDHLIPVQLMSSVYRSHILRCQNLPCVVKSHFGHSESYVS